MGELSHCLEISFGFHMFRLSYSHFVHVNTFYAIIIIVLCKILYCLVSYP